MTRLTPGSAAISSRCALRVAAGHQNLGRGILAMDAANGGAGVLIGSSGDRAGIQHDDFGLVGIAGALESALEQLTLNGCAVSLGRAAAEVLYMIGRHRLIILSGRLDVFCASRSGCTSTADDGTRKVDRHRQQTYRAIPHHKSRCLNGGVVLEFPMKRRILLVDDELAILLTLRAILEMNGFEVDTAASAKEAQKKLKNGVYEMVITDMRMETETPGYDVIQAARQRSTIRPPHR